MRGYRLPRRLAALTKCHAVRGYRFAGSAAAAEAARTDGWSELKRTPHSTCDRQMFRRPKAAVLKQHSALRRVTGERSAA